MKLSLKQELPLLAIVAIPFVYLAYLWNSLPEKVPIHWNINGEIDGWGTKNQLIVILLALPVLIYILFLVIPIIDPKKKLEKMGKKFYNLKLLMVLFMSVLAVFILYSVQSHSGSSIKVVFALLGFFFMGLGNYFQTLQPNYFIGIKTPWTLESETVWKATHKVAGKLWFFGGALLTLAVLVLPAEISFFVFMAGTTLLAIVPIVYSYTKYKALKN
ncbi:MAG: SdpI family protein [Maribacter sp.]